MACCRDRASLGPCTCVIEAGTGTTVTGTGSTDDPFVVSCDCGAATCSCQVVAGPNVTVTGTGDAGDPYVIAAGCGCAVVAGPNITVTGTGSTADPYVITGAGGGGGPILTGCGLTGDGVTTPLAAATAPWPFACAIAAEGDNVYCDPASGALKIRPKQRLFSTVSSNGPTVIIPAAEWCATQPTDATQFNMPAHNDLAALAVTNPDPCCPMLYQVEIQGRVRLNRDPNAIGESGIGLDYYFNGTRIGRAQYENIGLTAGGSAVYQDGERAPMQGFVLPPGGSAQLGWQLFQTGIQACVGAVTEARYNPPNIRAYGWSIDC